MAIKHLVESGQRIDVEETTFSLDVVGRYVCNTLAEAVNNGGRPFDVVVLGAGMCGAYCAEKIYHLGARNKRVLLLEAGAFLVSEHVQNLAQIGLNVAGPVSSDSGTPRERVWGLPWRSNEAMPGLAYCVGGRSLYWGGWAPRLTAADLALWPVGVANYLNAKYNQLEREIGVDPSTDYITGALYTALRTKLNAVAARVGNIDPSVEEAPLAVQGQPPASGLFSFDKYSSAPILIDAIREAARKPDWARRLFLVPRAHVIRLHASGGVVQNLEVDVNGQRKFLPIGPNCAVVLAMGAIESTRLALLSFPTPLMGRNLMVHLRTNLTVRIRRSALASALPAQLETAAALVRGSTAQARFHLQFTASASPSGFSEEMMFRMIPDLDLLDNFLASQNTDWVTITVRGLAEMKGDQSSSVPNNTRSWINLSPCELDEFGVARAWVQLVATGADNAVWDTMDRAALALVQEVAGSLSNIEYFYNQGWQSVPPTLETIRSQMREGLGTTHHESGTLWMGAPGSSVTDENGRFHHVSNAYVADLALFPTIGSANPALTGLTLARKVAEAIP
jgi:choline dehydrogenase-like flavoprotein